MKLADHGLRPRPAAPGRGAPVEPVVRDHLARSAHIVRLEMRGRVRHLELAVDAVFVECARRQTRDRNLVPAGRARLHRMRAVEHELHMVCRRRPEAEGDTVGTQLRAEAHVGRHAVPANTRTERGGASMVVPDANCLPVRGLGAVSSSMLHWPYSGSPGRVNAIASGAALSTM